VTTRRPAFSKAAQSAHTKGRLRQGGMDLSSRKSGLARYAARIHRLSTFRDVVAVSERLADARQVCRDVGIGWYEWLEPIGLSPDAAERLMSFARFVGTLPPAQVDVVSRNVSLKALYLLAQPSTPPETRAEIVQRAEQGERIDSGMVKRSRRVTPPRPQA
jgi:hypothetical protein